MRISDWSSDVCSSDLPARREVDRRFVYIDPTPGPPTIRFRRRENDDEGQGDPNLPGFFHTIFGALSDIPREQPIRDNLEAIEERSRSIDRMLRITAAIRPETEECVDALFGGTFYRTDERLVGEEGDSTCRPRGETYK